MKKKLIFLIIALVTLCSCAKPTVVDVSLPNDKNLNCSELTDEFNETRRFKKEAQDVKDFNTGGNMTRTLLFWPALVKTLHNALDTLGFLVLNPHTHHTHYLPHK